MKTIDARALACPAPVVKARAAIAALPPSGGLVKILVDNVLAAENLERMSAAADYHTTRETEGEGIWAVTITVSEEHAAPVGTAAPNGPSPDLVVAIGSAAMGQGSDELGEILIKSFLYTLSALDTPPNILLLFNSGATLAVSSGNTVADLQTLAERGTRILICGTCADYYDIRDKLGAGELVSMFEIVTEMQQADRLISL